MSWLRRNVIAIMVGASLALCGGLNIDAAFNKSAIAQGFLGLFQNGTSTVPSAYGVGDPTAGFYFGTGFAGIVKHAVTSGTTPTLSTCGTTPALASGSTDTAGKITVGTSASNACTLTFGAAYTTAPFCIVQNLTTGAAANVYAVATATIIWSSALADSTVLMYHCIAPAGG